MLSFKDAFQINTSLQKPKLKIKNQSIYQSQGCILAQNIFATRALPPFTHSAMDGYALDSTQSPPFKITDTILAGADASHLALAPNEAKRIMTGAMIPQGVDCVLPFENARTEDSLLFPLSSLKPGQNIRYQGEELQTGAMIAQAGEKLDFRIIGILASQGILEVPVFEKLKIGIFSSGNEVIEPGSRIKNYQVYNINAAAILSVLQNFGFTCEYLGILEDSTNLEIKLIEQCQNYDVLITSGGISVGDADLLHQILKKTNAKIFYHKVNLKPGKPITLALIQNCYLYCLPGNPLSAISNLLSLVVPSLEYLGFARFFYPQTISASLATPLHFDNKRTHILQGFYQNGIFTPHQKINANAISTFSLCNAFAIFDENLTFLNASCRILILPYIFSFNSSDSLPINII